MFKQKQQAFVAACIFTGMPIIFMSAASASSVYYNASKAYASNIVTDDNVGQDGIAGTGLTDQQANFTGYQVNTTFVGWDTSSSALPFGFNNERLNWAAEITKSGDALTVSSQDAQDRYGIWADIDTAKGAWFDGTSSGWEHQTDVGLIRSNVDTVVTINVTGIEHPIKGGLWNNFGVSVYSGMPEGQWKLHGEWNCPSCVLTLQEVDYRYAADFQSNNPLSQDANGNPITEGGMTYITHSGTVDSVNSISFNASAGTVYTILLGGNSGGDHYNPKEGYAVNISSAAPVPVPAALWLFGGALVSLTGAVRKNRQKVYG